MKCLMALTAILFFALPCVAQDDSFPSKEEIGELVQKASQKVTSFERAIKLAKPLLSEDRFKTDMDTAAMAHQIIGAIDKNGPSAYRLVALLIALDDLVVDGSASSQDILEDGLKGFLVEKPPNASVLAAVITVNTSDTAVSDIAELIGHSTLRMINVEEKAFAQSAK